MLVPKLPKLNRHRNKSGLQCSNPLGSYEKSTFSWLVTKLKIAHNFRMDLNRGRAIALTRVTAWGWAPFVRRTVLPGSFLPGYYKDIFFVQFILSFEQKCLGTV